MWYIRYKPVMKELLRKFPLQFLSYVISQGKGVLAILNYKTNPIC